MHGIRKQVLDLQLSPKSVELEFRIGMLVAGQKPGQGAGLDKLDIHLPGIAQHHDETIDRLFVTVGSFDLEITEVHLGLVPWGRLEAHEGLGLGTRPHLAHEHLELRERSPGGAA
mgnify:CR=1 FL=1